MRLSDAEWLLMNALWEDHPASARAIGERLPDHVQWAYTTIKTMLSRLVAKGAVSETKRGNTSLYAPLVSRDNARSSALSALLDRAFGGAVDSLLHCLASERSLSRRERAELRRLLEHESDKGSEKGDNDA